MILIDYRDSKAIYEQVFEKMQKLIITGVLKENEKIPSVRQLAMELSITPNTVQRAYNELENKGLIYSVKGRGSFVSSGYENFINEKVDKIKTEILKLIKEAKDIGIDLETIKSWVE